jgi:hypothetical protein
MICPVACGTCGPNPFPVLVTVLAGYGVAVIPVTYLFSLLFKKHSESAFQRFSVRYTEWYTPSKLSMYP